MLNLYSYIISMENPKNILIIGATSEIAQAIIREIKDQDYNILTTSRTGENSTYSLELTDTSSITALEMKIGKTPINWVLYCAGFIEANESLESFDGIYGKKSEQINFTAAARLFSTLFQHIEPSGGIIGLSSTAGIWGNPHFPIYSAWKGALNTFLQSLHKRAQETSRYVYSICPGPTNTKMRQSIAGDAEKHQSPDIVAKHIAKIIKNPSEYSNSPILIIRNQNIYSLNLELTEIR
jgi:short-subunit dehydrogenase